MQATPVVRNNILTRTDKLSAVGWNNKARGIGCRLAKPFVGREGEYYNWCMGTSDAEFRVRSPQALGHKANLEKFCTKQSGATINLN